VESFKITSHSPSQRQAPKSQSAALLGADEVRGINRVAYDIISKPPGTIGWE